MSPTLFEIDAGLQRTGYLADEGTLYSLLLATTLARPLFLEGAPGVGKTSLATSYAQAVGLPMVRLQCYEGLDVASALYDWDFARQILHMRAAQASGIEDAKKLEHEIYDRRYLLARPLLQALEAPCVLLIDEVDRADEEFEAFLLELLSDFAVTIPEVGRIEAKVPPVTFLTSNRTRDVHDALKRRCLYHYIGHPTPERESQILSIRVPGAPTALADQVADFVARVREIDVIKSPGLSESIDWLMALLALGARDLEPVSAGRALGSLLKYQEDLDKILPLVASL